MTIDNLFGNEKGIHLNRREYNIERYSLNYHHEKDELYYPRPTYSFENATRTNIVKKYGVNSAEDFQRQHGLTPEQVEESTKNLKAGFSMSKFIKTGDGFCIK